MTLLLIFDFLKILQIYIEDIRKKCNPMIDLSKFTSNKKILSGVAALIYNQVGCQSLSKV